MPEISCVRAKYSIFEMSECDEPGSFAKLRLTGHHHKIILKADKIETSKKMCDYFVFIKDNKYIVVLLELKENSLKCEDVFKKLHNGSILLNIIDSDCCAGLSEFVFYPLLLHRGGCWPSEIKMLKKKTIFFRRKPYLVICEKGICELNYIMRKYPN